MNNKIHAIHISDIDSLWLLERLKRLDLLRGFCAWWWEGAPSFEVVCGALLVQNSRWEGVQASIKNLKNARILSDNDDEESLSNLAKCTNIESLITPSGLFRQKSARLITLANAIITDFGDFSNFRDEVSREWLLSQKGIGKESADSILNYACGREIMVVDRYSYKLLCALGIEIEDYEELQGWFMDLDLGGAFGLYEGFCEDFGGVCGAFATGDGTGANGSVGGGTNSNKKGANPQISLAQIYARYHGKILEFSKRKMNINTLIAQ